MLRLLKNRSLILIYIIIFISIFTSTLSGGAVLVLYALELGATVTEITLINMLVGLFNTIFQLPLGIIADRVGRKFSHSLPRNYGLFSKHCTWLCNHTLAVNHDCSLWRAKRRDFRTRNSSWRFSRTPG